MEEAVAGPSCRRSNWRSVVTTSAVSILIVCLKLAWTPSNNLTPAAGTLAATEFVLNGKSAAASSYLQRKLALLHAASNEADSQHAARHSYSSSHIHSAVHAPLNSQIAEHVQSQALESPNSNNTSSSSGRKAEPKGNFVIHSDKTFGWDKSSWSTGDWASWLITGPGISIAFSFFMFYTYGTLAGVLTLLVCSCIDTATFYYNW